MGGRGSIQRGHRKRTVYKGHVQVLVQCRGKDKQYPAAGSLTLFDFSYIEGLDTEIFYVCVVAVKAEFPNFEVFNGKVSRD